MLDRRRVLLVQLPIPPLGPGRLAGNVPLAAGYLKMYAEQQGLGDLYDLRLFPTPLTNTLGDHELVNALLAERPWMVGFSCYLWNIDRTLWIANEIKKHRPGVWIILGGPEITVDNRWVLDHPAADLAAIGEGEQTFAEFLAAWRSEPGRRVDVPGLYQSFAASCGDAAARAPSRLGLPLAAVPALPAFRQPLKDLDVISSPYLAGLIDAAEENMMLLETLRGCVFKCKFCYYPKSYDDLAFVSEEKIVANLEYARRKGVREVVLLDPTLNQGRRFDDFVALLARCNPDRQFTYFGELRAEGITPHTAKLLRQAHFTEVEVGLQSIDPQAMRLMDRNNALHAVERGIRAMRAEGIRVKVDLIIGLPGDTVGSVLRGMDYLREQQLYDDVQVFNLAILPGTAFRQEAASLGLRYQPRPPYYVQQTPTLRKEDLYQLMQDARDGFELEWDRWPDPVLPDAWQRQDGESETAWRGGLCEGLRVHLDHASVMRFTHSCSQVFTLWFQASEWHRHAATLKLAIQQLLQRNPFTTLQLVLEPLADPRQLDAKLLQDLWASCMMQPTYLDRYFAMQPGRPMGAKRMLLLLASPWRQALEPDWLRAMGAHAALLWQGEPEERPAAWEASDLDVDEHWLPAPSRAGQPF